MAAKPPKPPGNFLNRSKNNNLTASNSNINNGKSTNSEINQQAILGSQQQQNKDFSTNAIDFKETPSTTQTDSNCNCTNISIMHLFHEMKQEFPTIPDTIVAQCVNDNCHQRENCIEVLRNELVLNPIPAQSYPSKVLHPNQQRNQGTGFKSFRVAPPPPNNIPHVKVRYNVKKDQSNCDYISESNHVNNSNDINNCTANSIIDAHTDPKKATSVHKKQNSDCEDISDMPTKTTVTLASDKSVSNGIPLVTRTKTDIAGTTNTTAVTDNDTLTTGDTSRHQPRVRPTTLDLHRNLQQQQQQQQRQNLHFQLQQHFDQRQLHSNATGHKSVPLRRAPLPPIPPKPVQISASVQIQQHKSPSSHTPHITSPISSDESELSVNVSLSSPTQSGNSTKLSPIRHRSVITLQPDPPYTRDLLLSPTLSSGTSVTSNGSSGNSQKSFTSVNLTLRQPNPLGPQSTVDVSAGPSFNGGNSSGLTYSSVSYDARRGYQKNFHITLTDDGGVFSASRIRPRSGVYSCDQAQDGPTTDPSNVNSLRPVLSEQSVLQKQQSPNRPFQDRVPSPSSIMCTTNENDASDNTLRRQKERRDKLASALRENKRKLTQAENEINVLIEPLNISESERLDSEILALRSSCQEMLNEIEIARTQAIANNEQCSSDNNNAINNLQHANLPQPFPRQRARQRPPRPPPPLVARPLEFIQHHSNEITTQSYTPTASSPVYAQQNYPYVPSTDEEEYSDSNTDGGDEDEESLDMWSCAMCTVRNHPQLNVCECCDFVRILPGTIRLLPSSTTDDGAVAHTVAFASHNASAPANATASPNATEAVVGSADVSSRGTVPLI